MESDIQFGDIEETRPETCRRPDQNRHYAVVACHEPVDGELKIYVDLDVMRDMESHALSDTRVELGGVLMGGQYEDENGEPFVWVTDSLRAEHYEATKGSFKFTHETWEQISRQRDEFPPELQMVGWYHTHPDWGVFLSGMDLFICQNFFNRKLDLALVIDPCRGDRGWFRWLEQTDQPQRTGGYYLTASRFRQAEVEQFALLSRGRIPMSPDPRYAPVAGQIGPQPTLVPMPPARQPVLEFGVLALIGLQTTLIVLLAWQLLRPADAATADNDATAQAITDIADRMDQLETSRGAEFAVESQQRLIRELVTGQGSSATVADRLTELMLQSDQQESELKGQIIAVGTLEQQLESTRRTLSLREQDLASTRSSAKAADKAKSEAIEARDKYKDELEEALAQAKGNYRWYRDWLYLVVLAGIAVLSAVGGMAASTYLRRDDEEPTPDESTLPPEVNYDSAPNFSTENDHERE